MKKNIPLLILLSVLIFGMILIIFLNKDILFKTSINITYPDMCEEEYVNGELVSPVCFAGRAMVENSQKKSVDIIWYPNMTE